MKKFLKCLGTGFIFFLMSVSCSMLGLSAYNGFVAVGNCEGWVAIGLCSVSFLLTLLAVCLIYFMGLIPLDSLERHKQRAESYKQVIKNLEDKER